MVSNFTFIRMRMRPSEREWMMSNFGHDHVRESYFEDTMRQLLRTYQDTTLIDDIWVGGIEHRTVYYLLDDEFRTVIETLNTPAAVCFLNGVYGREWDYGLSNK